jgi:hypothetical protein
MEVPEQVLTVDLPTILLDSRSARVTGRTVPGIEAMGYLAVEGMARVGLSLDSQDADPTRLQMEIRLLEARYEPPADCPPKVLETILRLNSALNDRLLGEVPPDA